MLKKINPKITAIVVMLLSLLVAGGISLDETIGGANDLNQGGDLDNTGM